MENQQHKKYRILLIGDSCIDEYQFGTVDRISPEAPVPILKYTRSDTRLGMGLNVCNNLSQLGCNVTFLSGKPSYKIRIVDEKTKHQIVRIDHDNTSDKLDLSTLTTNYDAVVFSDYDKGLITNEVYQKIFSMFNCPIFIDTKKKDLSNMGNAFVKINEKEFSELINPCNNLIVTLGGKGARYKDKFFPSESVEVSDVCGAGDTFLAAVTYFYLDSLDLDYAITMANKASAITVQHFGTYAPTLKEIL